METTPQKREAVKSFHFHGIHPNVRFGTASDRYAGWIGQIYPELYRDRVSSRRRKLGGKSYEERTVPVESTADFFEHFDVLEVDFTFYRPLRDTDGKPTTNFAVLQKYAEHAPEHAQFILKAPQSFFARKLRRTVDGKLRYVANPEYLDAPACAATFLEPAHEILGARLGGIIFEQEYQRVADAPDPIENIRDLDNFFSALPGAVQPHVEIRSEHLLVPEYFEWLVDRGLGFVFSHWTWLPPLRKQWKMCGERFTAADGRAVVRLLTPLDVPYAEAYARTHPFDRTKAEVAGTRQAHNMILDTTALVFQAESSGNVVDVIANNRAWGNAPALARAVAERIIEEEERRNSGRS